MLAQIKEFFNKKIAADPDNDIDHQLKLATAALLIEMMYQDDLVKSEEISTVKKTLAEKFSLTDDECNSLFELAEKSVSDAVDYHQFTRLIAKKFDAEQKINMIELLWSVAYADSNLSSLEEHMIRKIADLIYVSHSDFIKAKHAVQNKL